METNGVGIMAAVAALSPFKYFTWLRLKKVADSPALQQLARNGQLRTDAINMVRTHKNISLPALVLLVNPPPPKDFSREDTFRLPASFKKSVWDETKNEFPLHEDLILLDLQDVDENMKKIVWQEPVILDLMRQADDSYGPKDVPKLWKSGTSTKKGRKDRVFLLYDTAPDGSRPCRTIGFLWMQWTKIGYTYSRPCLRAYAVDGLYNWKGLGKVMTDRMFRLPDVSSVDHLIARIDTFNDYSVECLTKVGAKHGREFIRLGTVDVPKNEVDYREIREDDEGLMECCLSKHGCPGALTHLPQAPTPVNTRKSQNMKGIKPPAGKKMGPKPGKKTKGTAKKKSTPKKQVVAKKKPAAKKKPVAKKKSAPKKKRTKGKKAKGKKSGTAKKKGAAKE